MKPELEFCVKDELARTSNRTWKNGVFRRLSVGLALFAVAGESVRLTAATQPGSIAGILKSSSGKALRASIVLHDLSTKRVEGNVPFDRQFASKGDGTFLLTGVPEGKYEICVSGMNERILDPCVWAGSPKTVSLIAGQALNGVAVIVDTGVLLQIRVNDPQNLLPAPKGGVAGDTLKVGVVTKTNEFLHARAFSVDTSGRDHFLVVPAKESMQVVASSSKFTLTDSKSQKKANEESRDGISTDNGQDIPLITYTVGKP